MPSNMYLKLENPPIKGGCQVAGHVGEIEVLSWNHGFSQKGSPLDHWRDPEQATHQNFTFTKNLDSASSDLMKFCWSGKQIGKATLACYRTVETSGKLEEYLAVTMEHVIITGYTVAEGPGMPVENVTLDYGIVHYEYKHERYHDGSYRPETAKHDREKKKVE